VFAAAAIQLFCAFALSVLQGTDDPKKNAPKTRVALPQNWSKLGLSDEQKRRVYGIQAEFRVKVDELKQQIDDLKKKETQEMFKILTDAQKARLREILADKAPSDDKPNGPKSPYHP
jgi:hypothetical protein